MLNPEQRKSWVKTNRTKINEYMRMWRKSETGKRCELARHLLRKYNMTIEDKQRMWDDQKGLCAVCGNPLPNIFDRDCQVDHEHLANKVRALLHWHCNMLVGVMENTPVLLDKIVAYLKVMR